MYHVNVIENAIENVKRNEEQISLRKASLKDHTDEISITFSGNLAEKFKGFFILQSKDSVFLLGNLVLS